MQQGRNSSITSDLLPPNASMIGSLLLSSSTVSSLSVDPFEDGPQSFLSETLRPSAFAAAPAFVNVETRRPRSQHSPIPSPSGSVNRPSSSSVNWSQQQQQPPSTPQLTEDAPRSRGAPSFFSSSSSPSSAQQRAPTTPMPTTMTRPAIIEPDSHTASNRWKAESVIYESLNKAAVELAMRQQESQEDAEALHLLCEQQAARTQHLEREIRQLKDLVGELQRHSSSAQVESEALVETVSMHMDRLATLHRETSETDRGMRNVLERFSGRLVRTTLCAQQLVVSQMTQRTERHLQILIFRQWMERGRLRLTATQARDQSRRAGVLHYWRAKAARRRHRRENTRRSLEVCSRMGRLQRQNLAMRYFARWLDLGMRSFAVHRLRTHNHQIQVRCRLRLWMRLLDVRKAQQEALHVAATLQHRALKRLAFRQWVHRRVTRSRQHRILAQLLDMLQRNANIVRQKYFQRWSYVRLVALIDARHRQQTQQLSEELSSVLTAFASMSHTLAHLTERQVELEEGMLRLSTDKADARLLRADSFKTPQVFLDKTAAAARPSAVLPPSSSGSLQEVSRTPPPSAGRAPAEHASAVRVVFADPSTPRVRSTTTRLYEPISRTPNNNNSTTPSLRF